MEFLSEKYGTVEEKMAEKNCEQVYLTLTICGSEQRISSLLKGKTGFSHSMK